MIRRRFLNDFNEFKTNVPLPQRSRILRLTKFEVRPGGGGVLFRMSRISKRMPVSGRWEKRQKMRVVRD